jgi:pilus assembly protein CpaF
MRPDRIVVGEVRGREALAALAAMSIGHEGSMVTVHARSANEIIDRMVTLAGEGMEAQDAGQIRERFTRALDLLVFLERDEKGVRRVASIEHVHG